MSLTSYRAAPPRAKKRKTRTKSPGRPACKVSDPPLAAMLHEAGRPGGDLLSRALRQSTIGAAGFHGRVRNGIGWGTCAITTWSSSAMKHAIRRHCAAEICNAMQCAGAAVRHPKPCLNLDGACKTAGTRHLPLRTADQANRTISTS